ncbi:unnamed protein product [Allacma fusca]|uniref:Uncharacterized protein n=1 Tax=Allacma fusca TaxID=39272 RepID=A0A8J2KMD7_9HEXA|nr:unnamed protein product [Allacma fusca]
MEIPDWVWSRDAGWILNMTPWQASLTHVLKDWGNCFLANGATGRLIVFGSDFTFQPGTFPLQSRLFFDLTKQFAEMKAKLEQNNLAEF